MPSRGTFTNEERLRELGLFSLERVQVELIAALLHIKGTYWKAGEGLFFRQCSNRTRLVVLSGKREDLNQTLGRILYSECDEALAQAALRNCGCSNPGGVLSQIGWFLQRNLAYGRSLISGQRTHL